MSISTSPFVAAAPPRRAARRCLRCRDLRREADRERDAFGADGPFVRQAGRRVEVGGAVNVTPVAAASCATASLASVSQPAPGAASSAGMSSCRAPRRSAGRGSSRLRCAARRDAIGVVRGSGRAVRAARRLQVGGDGAHGAGQADDAAAARAGSVRADARGERASELAGGDFEAQPARGGASARVEPFDRQVAAAWGAPLAGGDRVAVADEHWEERRFEVQRADPRRRQVDRAGAPRAVAERAADCLRRAAAAMLEPSRAPGAAAAPGASEPVASASAASAPSEQRSLRVRVGRPGRRRTMSSIGRSYARVRAPSARAGRTASMIARAIRRTMGRSRWRPLAAISRRALGRRELWLNGPPTSCSRRAREVPGPLDRPRRRLPEREGLLVGDDGGGHPRGQPRLADVLVAPA